MALGESVPSELLSAFQSGEGSTSSESPCAWSDRS